MLINVADLTLENIIMGFNFLCSKCLMIPWYARHATELPAINTIVIALIINGTH